MWIRVPPRVRRLWLVAAVASVLLVPASLLAMHRQTPFLVALSNEPGGFSTNPGPPQGEPNHDYFQSSSDLKHNGSTGNEIFFYVLRQNLPDSNVTTQITNFCGDSEHPSSSEAGLVAAFDSDADIDGTGNSVRQIFLYYRKLKTFVQLTAGQADSSLPIIDQAADAVVFQSMAELKGTGAPTGYSQVY